MLNQRDISMHCDVPFYDCRATTDAIWPELKVQLDTVFELGKFSHGSAVEKLESSLCEYTGSKFAIGCNSGTDALVILLRCCGIGPGDEVIVPCFTFVASASSIALVGATPVFADVAPNGFDVDPESVGAKITDRTKAIMPVHLFHEMANMGVIETIAGDAGVQLIEDSAEAIGMRYGGKHAGLLGRGGVLSFFPTKTLGAFGDAGMILTNDSHVAKLAAVMRHHGRSGRTIANMPGISNEAVIWGYNSKMDDIQAAVLLARLTRLELEIARRAELAALYDRCLSELWPQIRIPIINRRDQVVSNVYYTYVILADRKRELMSFLGANGVATEDYYPRPLHLQPCFAGLGYQPGDFPNAESVCEQSLALPLYPDLENSQVDYVCELIRRFYRED